MYARILGALSVIALVSCSGSGSNPITGGDPDDSVVTDPGTDPNIGSADEAFLFDPANFLTANQFIYTPGATPGTGTIRINNLPFDGVSSEGGAYTERPGVVLPNGQVFANTPGAGEDQYYAVILQSPSGTGSLIGAVGTDVYAGAGYGGAYARRAPSSGLPPDRAAAYIYNGQYNGIRITRQTEAVAPRNSFSLTTGDAQVIVDLQDLDPTGSGTPTDGSIRGDIFNRQLFDVNGNNLGTLSPIQLIITGVDSGSGRSIDGTTGTFNADGTRAQSGEFTALFSGPNGEEVIGYLVVEGTVSDRDPEADPDPTRQLVTGREVGGFVTSR